MNPTLRGALCACASLLATAPARAGDAEDEFAVDYDTRRTEPSAFPVLGGNSDIGVQVGAAGRLVRFGRGVRPYVYRADLVITASGRAHDGGFGLAQQQYVFKLDIPNLLGGPVRTTPSIQYTNFVDAGYYGRGNASSPDVPAGATTDPGRYHQQLAREVRVRDITRMTIERPFYAVVAPEFRFHDHHAYGESKLEADDRAGLVRGLRPVPIVALSAGLIIDSRDNEFFPRSGMYHQIAQRFEQGFPLDGDVQAGATSGSFVWYFPLGERFVGATRVVLDFLYGKVPFFDLYEAGPFVSYQMPGGANGIRGVPWGRYSAPIKSIVNLELRTLYFSFGVLKQRFRIGNDVFFDTGRVFDAYRFDAPRDGKGIGLKWGAGGGLYVEWGTSVYRAELAFSPEALAANPSFPLGLYIADGVMF